MAASMLTAARLRELLHYDPLTGIFTWRVSRRGHARAGDYAGTRSEYGYVIVCFDGDRYRAHRLAWLYLHGKWPAGDIDHINRNKDDNRIDNLRDVPRHMNAQNKIEPNRDGTTGFLGVTYHKQRHRYMAHLRANGKAYHLGMHDTAEAAHAAYMKAKRLLHPGNML